MTAEHQTTREEKAYLQLLDETWEVLSEPAQIVIRVAHGAANAENMVDNYCFQPEEYDDDMEMMRLAAAGLSDREQKLFAKVWRASLAAAASIDSENFETLAGYRAYSGNLHYYYRMISGMIEEILEERRIAERREKIAKRHPEDLSDLLF